jgi:hypothetical protein
VTWKSRRARSPNEEAAPPADVVAARLADARSRRGRFVRLDRRTRRFNGGSPFEPKRPLSAPRLIPSGRGITKSLGGRQEGPRSGRAKRRQALPSGTGMTSPSHQRSETHRSAGTAAGPLEVAPLRSCAPVSWFDTSSGIHGGLEGVEEVWMTRETAAAVSREAFEPFALREWRASE